MEMLRIRKPARQLSYRQRFSRLTSQDQVKLRKLRKLILVCLTIQYLDDLEGESEDDVVDAVLVASCLRYLSISIDTEYTILDRPIRTDRTIDSFSPTDCYAFFTFTKVDLIRLFALLRFPVKVTFSNRATMSGEEDCTNW